MVDSEEEAEEVTRGRESRAGDGGWFVRLFIRPVSLQVSAARLCRPRAGVGCTARNGVEPGAQTQTVSSCSVLSEGRRRGEVPAWEVRWGGDIHKWGGQGRCLGQGNHLCLCGRRRHRHGASPEARGRRTRSPEPAGGEAVEAAAGWLSSRVWQGGRQEPGVALLWQQKGPALQTKVLFPPLRLRGEAGGCRHVLSPFLSRSLSFC